MPCFLTPRMKPDAVRSVMEGVGRRAELAAVVAADLEAIHCRIIAPSLKTPDDLPQYPLEVLNRAADIFRMAGHMLGQRLLLFLLHHVIQLRGGENERGRRSG